MLFVTGCRDDSRSSRRARLDPVNLGEPANDELLERRLRKIVLKNIGILYYWLPTNYNPNSALYDDINSVEDIDKMGEDF